MGKERCVCGRVGSGMGVLELTLALTPPGRVVTWHRRRFPRGKLQHAIGHAVAPEISRFLLRARDISPLVSSGRERELRVKKRKMRAVVRTGPYYS